MYIQPIVKLIVIMKKWNFYFEINVSKNQCFSIRHLKIYIWESKYRLFKNKALFVSLMYNECYPRKMRKFSFSFSSLVKEIRFTCRVLHITLLVFCKILLKWMQFLFDKKKKKKTIETYYNILLRCFGRWMGRTVSI